MNYELHIAGPAQRYVDRLPQSTQERVLSRLEHIVVAPFGPHTNPLKGPGEHRGARVGGLRIVFTVNRDRRLVDVSDIGPRGQFYRRL